MKTLTDKSIQNLTQEVKQAVMTSLNFILSKYETNEIFVYALYTNDYFQYLGWAANTISHYEKLKNSFPIEEYPFIKWYYSEFAIGTGEGLDEIDKPFNQNIQEILDEIQSLLDDESFEIIQANVYDSIIEGFKLALDEMNKDKIENIIFYISLADSDNAEIMENYSAEKLNSSKKFLLFKSRYS